MEGFDLNTLFKWGMKRTLLQLQGPLDKDGPILNLGAGKSDIEWDPAWRGRVIDMDWPSWNADMDGLHDHDDETVDGIFAFHFLEHLEDPIWFLRECQRVLRQGAPLTIVVPYYNAQIMAHDLSHTHAFCEDTWKVLFSREFYDKNSMHAGQVKPWQFAIGTNVIMGIVERNLSLFTQLIKY